MLSSFAQEDGPMALEESTLTRHGIDGISEKALQQIHNSRRR
jgi:hypothetical protein